MWVSWGAFKETEWQEWRRPTIQHPSLKWFFTFQLECLHQVLRHCFKRYFQPAFLNLMFSHVQFHHPRIKLLVSWTLILNFEWLRFNTRFQVAIGWSPVSIKNGPVLWLILLLLTRRQLCQEPPDQFWSPVTPSSLKPPFGNIKTNFPLPKTIFSNYHIKMLFKKVYHWSILFLWLSYFCGLSIMDRLFGHGQSFFVRWGEE